MSAAPVPAVVHVPADGWRSTCEQALADGARFRCLYAVAAATGLEVRLVLGLPTEERLLTAPAVDNAIDTVLDLFPAANWDEREAHDLYGVRFAGHEPLRPLVEHTPDLSSWTTPVHGHGPHQVAVGPIHAGVIESGHFRFHVVGERVLHLDLRLFYKHRGLERAAEGRSLDEAVSFVQRACAAGAVANCVAYAQASEAAVGLAPAREVRRARTLLCELERLYNHLNDLSAICAGIGFAAGAMAFAALKERMQRLNRSLTGHRFLFGRVELGASALELDGHTARAARADVRSVRADAAATWRELLFASSVQDRLRGVGVVTAADAEALGAVGPSARAAGLRRDARSESEPLLWYGHHHPLLPDVPSGDVAARAEMRALELQQSCELLEELLAGPVERGRSRPGQRADGVGVGRVEGPRGETVCVVESAAGRVRRLHLRTGSYANWPVLAHTVPGNLLPDFPLINKSFELCYACADR
jgi:Ni,Fe-hydrogenase III large subunit